MQCKLFLLLFFLFIISSTFSSNNQKRKRQTENNTLNLQDENAQDENAQDENAQDENTQDDNAQEDYSQITYQPVPPSTNNLQINNIIFSDLLKPQNVEISSVPSDLLNKLLEIPNVFRYIFAYLSFFELEFKFKYISTTFYDLYEKFLKEEKHLLKEHLKNQTKFLENINCKRVYFDFFEKRHWSDPGRTEYVNVDCFCEDLIIFPKSIRQIIRFTFEEIEYKYVLFKNGHLSILKKVNKDGYFVFTSVDNNDFQNFESYINSIPFGEIYSFQENIRYIEIDLYSPPFILLLHKMNNFSQNIWHMQDDRKIIISDPFSVRNPKLFLKNGSGYLRHDDKFVSLWEFEKQNNGIYIESLTHVKINVKEIQSNDFEHYVADVSFIYHKN